MNHRYRARSIALSAVLAATLLVGCNSPSPRPSAAAEPTQAAAAPAPTAPTAPAPPAAADGQCTSRVPDFTKSTPPLDYEGANPNDETALAVFAWQHFVALNWPASYVDPSAYRTRGTPSTRRGTFLRPNDGSRTTTVWETYRNKNEMFPAGSSSGQVLPDADYNGRVGYRYTNGTGTNGAVRPCVGGAFGDFFINLDENSQLGLDYMFAQPSGAAENERHQILYLAKVNKTNYDYIVSNKLYDKQIQDGRAQNNVAKGYYALCQQTSPLCDQASYCLPCGGPGGSASPPSEGTIHVKAAWRKLTPVEAASGRYLTAPVVLYRKTGDPKDKKVCASNGDGEWGLIGLHIIHKTVEFPTFFFSTWEHVDNLQSNLTYRNTLIGGPSSTVGQYLPYQRAVHAGKSLPSTAVGNVNTCVQTAIAEANPASVWQYYQLVGVQGPPVDLANSAPALPSYYLANNVIESNEFFQGFMGTKGKYHDNPAAAIGSDGGAPYLPDGYLQAPNTGFYPRGITDNIGGCQGCHGNSQTQRGFDMSFVSAGFADKAEAIDDFETESLRAQYLEVIQRPPAPPKP